MDGKETEMINKAPESFVAKVQAAIVENDPEGVVRDLDELTLQKTAYYIFFTFQDSQAPGGVAFPDDHNVAEIFDIIKFVSSFEAPCGHQAYKQVTTGPLLLGRSIIACGERACNNYIY
jgi:hypothetical protein